MRVTHTLEPIYDKDARVLILGTFPSVKSREGKFYYHHPQNRFWKVISILTASEEPDTVPEKKELLLKNQIAVWDVIKSCDIEGSSDSSIKNVVPNDIKQIVDKSQIRAIFANGNKAFTLYNKYCLKSTGCKIIKLPSTSPANASYSLERLVESWRAAFDQIDQR